MEAAVEEVVVVVVHVVHLVLDVVVHEVAVVVALD